MRSSIDIITSSLTKRTYILNLEKKIMRASNIENGTTPLQTPKSTTLLGVMLQRQLLTLSVNGRATAPVSIHFTRTNQYRVDGKCHRVSPANINGGDWDCYGNKFLQYKQ